MRDNAGDRVGQRFVYIYHRPASVDDGIDEFVRQERVRAFMAAVVS